MVNKKRVTAKSAEQVKKWMQDNPNITSSGWLTKAKRDIIKMEDAYFFMMSTQESTIYVPPEVKEHCYVKPAKWPAIFEWDHRAEKKAKAPAKLPKPRAAQIAEEQGVLMLPKNIARGAIVRAKWLLVQQPDGGDKFENGGEVIGIIGDDLVVTINGEDRTVFRVCRIGAQYYIAGDELVEIVERESLSMKDQQAVSLDIGNADGSFPLRKNV